MKTASSTLFTRNCINVAIASLLVALPTQGIAEEKAGADKENVEQVVTEEKMATNKTESDQTTANEDAGAEAPLLAPVVVSVTPQSERSHSVTFISKEKISSQHMQNMNDVLFFGVPGVNTARNSNLGWSAPNSGFKIRGLIKERVAVFVDGIPSQVNNHFHPLVDQYTPDLVERLEVTRGSSAVKHGSGAVGGVIDIYTTTPKPGMNAYATVVGGRFNTKEVQAQVGFGGENGTVQLGVTDRSTDGFNDNPFDGTTVNFKTTYELNPTWEAGFRYGQTRTEIGRAGPNKSISTQDPTNVALTLDRRTADSSSFMALYWNQAEIASLKNGAGLPTNFVRFDEAETGVRLRHDWLNGPSETYTVGLDAVTSTDDRTNDNGLTYIKDELSYASPYVHASYPLGKNVIDGGVRVTGSSDFDTDVSPELGLVHHVDQSLAMRTRVGHAFRVPRVNDTFKPFGTPNLDLDPESFWEAEIGSNKTFMGRRAVIDGVIWYRDGDNLIVCTGGGGGTCINSGQFNHKGFEASLDVSVNSIWSYSAAVTLQDTKEELEVPQKIFDLGTSLRQGRFGASFQIRHASDILANATTGAKIDDYTVADLRFAFLLNKHLEIFADIDNIFDEVYETKLNNPQVPRAVFVGVRTML